MSDTMKKILISIAIAAITAAATKGIEELSKVSVDELFASKEDKKEKEPNKMKIVE